MLKMTTSINNMIEKASGVYDDKSSGQIIRVNSMHNEILTINIKVNHKFFRKKIK